MARYIQKHWIAFAFALIFGGMLMAPHIRHHIVADDELFYMARIQDVVDGHPFIGNAYLWEHKSDPPEQLFLVEWFLAQPMRLFHVSVPVGMVFEAGIAGFIVFLLVYILFYLVSRHRALALGAAVFLLYGLLLTDMIRPISPQFNIIFLLLQAIFLWQLISSGSSERRWWIFSGVSFGLLFYVYPYYWTHVLVASVLLGIFLAIVCERSRAMQILKMLVLGGAVSIPYWYLTHLASQLPEYGDIMGRLTTLSHLPSGINVLLWSVGGFVCLAVFAHDRLRVRAPGKEL